MSPACQNPTQLRHLPSDLDHPCLPEGSSETHKDASQSRHTAALCADHLFWTSFRAESNKLGSPVPPPTPARNVISGADLAEAEKSPWSDAKSPVEGEKQVRIRGTVLRR